MVRSRCGSQAYLSFSATRKGAASDLRTFRMGFEVTIYAFVVLPLHFDPVVWNEDNAYATYEAIRSAAPFKCDLDRRFDWLDWSLKRFGPAPLAGWAIGGRQQITPDARSSQGFPIWWNAPDICKDISLFLAGVDEARLQSVIDY